MSAPALHDDPEIVSELARIPLRSGKELIIDVIRVDRAQYCRIATVRAGDDPIHRGVWVSRHSVDGVMDALARFRAGDYEGAP